MKDPTRRTIVRASAVAAIAGMVALSGCSPSSSTGAGSTGLALKKDTLTIAQALDPRSLYPTISNAQGEVNVSEQITEKLIEFNAAGSGYEPRLATKWNQVDDSTLQLSLRQGVKFSNGEPFNAESAKASIATMVASSTYSAQSEMIDSVQVVDDQTLNIKLKHPSGLTLSALAAGSFQYPAKYFAEAGPAGFGGKPIGTGPFMLDEWQKGQSVKLKANPGYWNGKPAIEHVVFSIIPDKQAQVLAATSGQVDVVQTVPVGSIDSVKNAKSLNFKTVSSNRNYYVAFSELTKTPIADPKVRLALLHAIDVKSIIKNQLGGLGTPLQGQAVPKTFFGFDESLEPNTYDPALAKKMLAAAGYPNGFSGVTFKYTTGYYAQDREIGQAIAAQLADVGVKVNQEVLEPGTFLDQIASLKLNDMFFQGPLLPPDAQFVYRQFKTKFAYSYYSSPTIDDLLNQANNTSDNTKRAQFLGKMAQIFQAEDPPFVPLFQGMDTYAVSNQLKSFELRPNQFLDLRSASF